MNRTGGIGFVLLMLLLALSTQAQEVSFSQSGGFYEQSFDLVLECPSPYHIRYTTNGNRPTAQSSLYVNPLHLDEGLYSQSDIFTIVNCIPSTYHAVDDVEHAIVIRAAAFDGNDSCIGPVATQTYFIKALGCDLHGLPVLSLAADSLDLFDYETGIFMPGIHYNPMDSTGTGNYNMSGREWERQINMEFYEPDNSGINQRCGLRTHGGASRWFQQKGMRLYAREEYGKKRFKHPFFDTTPVANIKRINLHPFRCSNWLQTGGQEYLSQSVAARLDVDGLGVREAVVFINGEYWGIYTLEESPDERYLEDHYDVDIDQVNILKYWGVTVHGDGMDWWRFRNWIETADLNQSADSAYAFSRIDMPSFIDYFLLETFGANLDWPQNNVLQWQACEGEPFRMIFFDGDGCFSKWYYDAISHATQQEAGSLIINKLMESDGFKMMLYDRYVELRTSTFCYDTMKSVWDEYRNRVEAEVPQQSERFGFPQSMSRWQSDMDSTDAFFIKRVYAFNEELDGLFEYSGGVFSSMMVYPVPNNGNFFINMDAEKCALLPVEVVDVLGRIVYTDELFLVPGENRVPMSLQLHSGMYFLKIGNVMKRIVIQ